MKSKTRRPNCLLCSLVLLTAFATSCVHKSPVADAVPEWLTASPRTVNAGRIFYVGSATGKFLERARSDAEGAALEDIANECSFVPTAVKKENEIATDDAKASLHTVRSQYSVTIADCYKAQATFSPEEIRIFANVPAAQKIQKHQDSAGESIDPSNGAQDAVRPGDLDALIYARQQIALRKQAVILAGPTRYRLHTPESKRFFQKIKLDSDPVISLGKQPSAQTMTSSWSSSHQKNSDIIPLPVLSSDSPAAPPAPSATPAPGPGKRKGPKTPPKSFPKN